MHPFYNQTGDLSNDIGLIKIKEEIEFTPKIEPIQIDSEPLIGEGKIAHIAGWGTTEVKCWLPFVDWI